MLNIDTVEEPTTHPPIYLAIHQTRSITLNGYRNLSTWYIYDIKTSLTYNYCDAFEPKTIYYIFYDVWVEDWE